MRLRSKEPLISFEAPAPLIKQYCRVVSCAGRKQQRTAITMNAAIQGQLDRIETALNALVASIESYNPSVPAAIDLLAADTELQQGVKQRTNPGQLAIPRMSNL